MCQNLMWQFWKWKCHMKGKIWLLFLVGCLRARRFYAVLLYYFFVDNTWLQFTLQNIYIYNMAFLLLKCYTHFLGSHLYHFIGHPYCTWLQKTMFENLAFYWDFRDSYIFYACVREFIDLQRVFWVMKASGLFPNAHKLSELYSVQMDPTGAIKPKAHWWNTSTQSGSQVMPLHKWTETGSLLWKMPNCACAHTSTA